MQVFIKSMLSAVDTLSLDVNQIARLGRKDLREGFSCSARAYLGFSVFDEGLWGAIDLVDCVMC